MLLVPVLLSTGAIVGAAQDSLEGNPVASIAFEPAEQPLPRDELLRTLPFHAGDPYSAAFIRDAIQRLYGTGRYADIAVDARAEAAGVAVRFVTTFAYFVGSVTAEGSPEPPNPGQLATATKLQLGAEFAPNDVHQALERIQDRLRANGLFHATVAPRITRRAEIQEVDLDFKVDPGARAKFDGIDIQGDPGRPAGRIVRSTGWKRPFGLFGWRPLTENRLQTGIDNVRGYYRRHDRLLAQVSLSALPYDDEANTVTPVLSIVPGPLIQVETRGAKLSKGKLRQLLPIYQEHSVDRSLLAEGDRNLVEYLQSQGYFDAEVTHTVPRTETEERTIEYTIERRERHRLVRVEIVGNRYFDTNTIRERMYILPASLLRFPHGRYSQRYIDKDVGSIQDLYRSNGFRDAVVTSKVLDNYLGKEGALAVVVTVVEGPQWLVSGLSIEGVSPQDRDYLLGVVHSIQGQPFSEYNVATDRDAVLAYYFNNGYPNAAFDWSQTPDTGNRRVGLRYAIRPGDRQVVRRVVVEGLRHTRPALVNSRIDFGAGDPISQVRISDAQRRLYDLGIFAKVQTAVQNPGGREESKYVLYQMEEARRYSTTFGFGAELARIGGGVTTFDAPAGTAGFSPRVSFGVSRLNLLGLGHTVSLQTRVSTLQQRALLSYFAPQFQGNDNLTLTFTGLYDNSRDVRTFSAWRLEGAIQLGQRLTRADTLQYRFNYRDVFVDPNSVKINPQLIPILSQSVRVGQFSTTFIQDRRDDPTDARKGLYQTLDAAYAAGPFGSQTTFLRLVARNSTYRRLNREFTFARTTNFGLIDRQGGLPDIPLPERFFSGGAYSNRAFPDNQAGPRDPITGFPLGGKAVLMNSLELRFPLIGENLGGVLFHDMGNVYTSLNDISFRFRQRDVTDFNYMVHAVGFGIRYRTPIGPIRADVAFSPNSPRFIGFQGSREALLTCSAPGSATPCQSLPQRINIFQFHFSLGQAF